MRSSLKSATTVYMVTTVSIVVAIGLGIRVHYSQIMPINSDQAVVGLMAVHIRHRDWPALYWGQYYGGVEPYIASVLGLVLGYGVVLIKATPIVLGAIASVVVFAVLRLKFSTRTASIGAAITWIWPANSIWNSLRETGFRGAEAVLGLLFLFGIASLQIWPKRRWIWLGTAFTAGLALWASPEFLYFVLPAILATFPITKRLRLRFAFGTGVGVAFAFMLGAFPWIGATFHSHFKTIAETNSPSSPGNDYVHRLGVFASHIFPLAIGTQVPLDGRWLFGPVISIAITTLVALVLVYFAIISFWRSSALGCFSSTLLLYPFIFSMFSNSSYWNDGRYATYLPYLIAVVFIDGIATTRTASPAWKRIQYAMLLATLGTSIYGLLILQPVWDPPAFMNQNPNSIQANFVRSLTKNGLRDVYAQYWVAYVIDYLGKGTVIASQLGGDQRYGPFDAEVQQAKNAAYIFGATPSPSLAQAMTWGTPTFDPLPVTAALLVDYLKSHNLGYRQFQADGFLVIIPSHNVIPETFMS